MSPSQRQREFPGLIETEYRATLAGLVSGGVIGRLKARDTGLWTADETTAAAIRRRLGWLDAPPWLRERVPELKTFAAEIRAAGFTRVLLLGWAAEPRAEVFQRVGIAGPGAPTLRS